MNSANTKNFVDVTDSIKIIILAIFTNLFAEFLTWMFIYRTKKYKESKKNMDILSRKLEINKE